MQYAQYKPSGSLTAKDIDGTRVESVWRQKVSKEKNMRHL